MRDSRRFGRSRDPFSAGRVYWLRGLAIVVVSVLLAVVLQTVQTVA